MTKPKRKDGPPLVPKDVVGALHRLGIRPERANGGEIAARCPGHYSRLGRADRRAGSWSISTRTGKHHCFSCGFGGDFTILVMEIRGWSRRKAQMWVVSLGAEVAQEEMQPEEYRVRVEEASLVLYSPPPTRALKRRGLTAEAAAHYGVLWDPEEDAWILPFRDEEGSLIGWQRKWEGESKVRNHPRGLRKGQTLFGIDRLESDEVVLVESPLDAAKVHAAGISGAVAVAGARLTVEQKRILLRRARRLVLALDNDEPGRRAAEDVVNSIGTRLGARVFDYDAAPDAKDPGDMTYDQIVEGYEGARYFLLDKVTRREAVTSSREN